MRQNSGGQGRPIIAIVGRPNVGKSTLFNRLIGSRRAITLDLAGVSRDRHYGHASWNGKDFVVVDTGGFPDDPSRGLKKKVREQIDLAIREADIVLLLMDGKAGLLPEDQEIGRHLRKSSKKVVVAVTKIDEAFHESRLSEFYSIGRELFPVSGEHGYGVAELLDHLTEEFRTEEEEAPKRSELTQIAIMGRPNVGKSSLLNRLLGEERVVVDETPGTTRDVIDTDLTIDGKRYRILDTAGIRRHGKWSSELERFAVLQTLKAADRSDVCLILLDAKEGIHRQDLHVVGYAFEAKKEIVLVLNKWDLVPYKRGVEKIYKEQLFEKLRFLAHAPLLLISAKTGQGLDSLWPTIDRLHTVSGKRVKTSQLNDFLEELTLSHNPPIYKGKPVKFYYVTQVGVHPPTFVVFVNEPTGVHFSYQRYFLNAFRKKFEFEGAPLMIYYRKKK
ncbi:MAG: ribosome biogenesis GTPase Der [Deltaproteobacteria bacterium]|nr:ribosome biogenesis GTPase Der [Deltaproteobacteria bacterium]